MAKATSTVNIRVKPKVTRKGVHSKKKTSKNKNSKNYNKPYRGQGN